MGALVSALVVQGLQELQAIRNTRVITSTIVVHEYVVTFEEEMKLMWHGKWTLVRVLYFVIRYYGLLAAIISLYSLFAQSLTNDFCIRILQWDIVTVFLAMWLTEAVLIIRLYALYNRSRIFLAFMLICYAASTAYTVWILAQDIEIATLSVAISIPGPGGVTCTFPGLARKAYTFFIPFAAFDSLLCAFAVYRGYLSFRSSQGLHGSPVNRLLKVMTRDSIFNYVILSLSYIAGTVIWVRLPAAYIEIPSVFIATLCYILATRMVLNIRDTASLQRNESTNPTSNPTIEFAAFSLTGRSEVPDTVLAPEP